MVQLLKPSRIPIRATMLVHGPPKSGKTVLTASACQVPELTPVLNVNCDGNAGVIADHFGDEVDVALCSEFSDLIEVGEALSAYNGSLRKGGKPYGCVIVDNVTSANSLSIERRMASVVEEMAKRRPPVEYDPDVIRQNDFGVSRNAMIRLFRLFAYLPTTVIFLAWTRYENEEDARGNIIRTYARPSLPGQLVADFCGSMPMIGYLENKGRRTLHFKETTRHFAADQNNCMPDTMPDPTMAVIYERLKNKRQGVKTA